MSLSVQPTSINVMASCLVQVFRRRKAVEMIQTMLNSSGGIIAINCKAGFHRTSAYVALLSCILSVSWLLFNQFKSAIKHNQKRSRCQCWRCLEWRLAPSFSRSAGHGPGGRIRSRSGSGFRSLFLQGGALAKYWQVNIRR